MRIFLSHRSRDKALLREFRSQLPSFLETGLDEESLSWGDSFPTELKLSIQSGAIFSSSSWITMHLALNGLNRSSNGRSNVKSN
jgi:hypothetical protein